jgi:hypothetical protein
MEIFKNGMLAHSEKEVLGRLHLKQSEAIFSEISLSAYLPESAKRLFEIKEDIF